MLNINNVHKSYKKGVEVLRGIGLNVEAGDLFAFVGQNGAGKTTLIKCCCGIHDFEQGEILIDGVDIKKDPMRCKKNLAYVPDNPDMYSFLTGYGYINFICDVYGMGDERKARLEELSRRLDIQKSLGLKISEYSHGMKQKIALIGAFIRNAKVLIFDEPFVGLDPFASSELKKMMREFCDNGGCIFFSTHVLEVAEKLCNKVAIIKAGQIVASGTMQDIKGDKSLEEVFLAGGE